MASTDHWINITEKYINGTNNTSGENETFIQTENIINGTNSTLGENDFIFHIGIIDGVVIIVYTIISISIGLYIGRNHKTAEDYFLAGRSMKWPFVGLSLFATNVSSSALVGLAGAAYKSGISVFNFNWTAVVSMLIFGTFFLPILLKSKVHTLPQILEMRYSSSVRYYHSAFTIVLGIVTNIGSSLYGGALVMKMIFPQLEIWHSVLILAVIAGIYTISGGLTAVMYTDGLQAVTLFLGSVLISVYAYIEVGGWSAIKENVPKSHLSIIRPVDDDAVPWTGVIFGTSIGGFYYWCTNQTIVQRAICAKDLDHGRWGVLLGSVLNLPILFIMVFPGTIANMMFPDLPKPDLVYPKLMFTLLPVGVLGVVLSGFMAALLSDVDSGLNSASTLITMDFVKKFWPDLTSRQLMNVGRLNTLIIIILSVCFAPLIDKVSSLYYFMKKIFAYTIPPIVALYVVGYFWKGANARGAIVTLILGNIWGLAFFIIVEVLKLFEIHFLHIAPILFWLCVIMLITVSLIDGKPNEESQYQVIWTREAFFKDFTACKAQPLWKNYYAHALLQLVLAVVLVGCFW